MSKSSNFKRKVKAKEVKKNYKIETNVQYVRDYYLKDFKYIGPERVGVGVNKSDRSRNQVENVDGNRGGSFKLFAKLWLVQVMKGLKQFLYEGSLHGVKYIFEPTFTRTERLTWVIIVVISIAFCAVHIIQLFSKWTSTPFVNVIDSLPTPIWAIPFPSVVLCPQLHVKRSYANVSELNHLKRFFAGLVCPQMKVEKIRMQNRMTAEETKLLLEFIIKGSPSCKEVIKACNWKPHHGSEWSTDDCCEKLFKPIFTNYGLCFTFNSLPLNGLTNDSLAWLKSFSPTAEAKALEWNLDKGYPKSFIHDPDMIPWRNQAPGEANGLGLELYLNNSEHQFSCDGNNVGFTILIRSPTDHVYTSTVVRLPMNRMTSIEVDPTTFKTDSSLRSLKPDLRQCYFQNERKLQNFLFYTGPNCKHDLFMQQARSVCNCALYSWPRKYASDPICSTVDDYECLRDVKDNLEEQLVYAYYVDSDEERRQEFSTTIGFSCYPSCNYITYNIQVFYSNLVHRLENTTTFVHSNGKKEIAQMNVHFLGDLFLGQHRHAQYDDYYFAGAIGGLLSLFLGFSIISVAELVYFVIFKPIRTAFLEVFLGLNS